MRIQSPKASEQLSIVFDFRSVAGPLDADVTLDAAMAKATEHPVFLQHLARRALDLRPPIGFVRGIIVDQHGEHPGRWTSSTGGS